MVSKESIDKSRDYASKDGKTIHQRRSSISHKYQIYISIKNYLRLKMKYKHRRKENILEIYDNLV